MSDFDGEEMFCGAVTGRIRAEELECAFDDFIIAERLEEQWRRFIDALAEDDRVILSASAQSA